MNKRLCALCLLLLLLPLCGCWDHLEINKTLIIAGVGLDLGAGGTGYRAAVEIVNVEADRGERITAAVVTGEGDTIQSALQDAMKTTGGILFGNQCKVVVLGEDLARQGIHPVIETLLRSPNFRKTVDILVARGETAAEILTGKTVNNEIVSYELSKIAHGNAKAYRSTVLTGAYELHERLFSASSAAAVPAVFFQETDEGAVLQVDGCALLTAGVLQGFLDGTRVPLLHLLTDGAGDVSLRLPTASAPEGVVDVYLRRGSVTLTPSLAEGVPAVAAAITAEVSLRDGVLRGRDLTDRGVISRIETELAAALAAETDALITESQRGTGADLLDFYLLFADRYRSAASVLEDDWETYFRRTQVKVSAEVTLTASGLIDAYAAPADPDRGNALP